MMSPLNTDGYDNVVVIDSQVVLEGKPLEQLPWGELFDGTTLLLVVRQVQTEIDKRKSDARLGTRARAFNRMLDGFITTQIPSTVRSNPKVDVATVSNRPIAWDTLEYLDRDDADDRIVAQALNAVVSDPSAIVLLSHDMRPRVAATHCGLKSVKLPESWLREPEQSPDKRRIAELEAKLRLLSTDQPELLVTIEAVTPQPWEFHEIVDVPNEYVQQLIDKQLDEEPYQRPRSPFGGDSIWFDDTFSSRVREWKESVHRNAHLLGDGLTKLYSQHVLRVSVKNIGSVPTEDMCLEICSGNAVLHSRPYYVFFDGPPPPKPRMLHERLDLFSSNRADRGRNDPYALYWDERGPGERLVLTCNSLRQGKSHYVDIYVELLAKSVPKFHIEAIVTAVNLKGDARGRALLDIGHVRVPCVETFDPNECTLLVRPVCDINDMDETEPFDTYNNDGSKGSSD